VTTHHGTAAVEDACAAAVEIGVPEYRFVFHHSHHAVWDSCDGRKVRPKNVGRHACISFDRNYVVLGDRSCVSFAKAASPAPHNVERHRRNQAEGYRAVAFKSRDDVKLFAKTSIPIRCCIMDLNTV
jgi:hypothetical protein